MKPITSKELEFEKMSICDIVACKGVDNTFTVFKYMDYEGDLNGGLAIKLHKHIIELDKHTNSVHITHEQLQNLNDMHELDGELLVSTMIIDDARQGITKMILNKIAGLGHANFVSIDKLSFWLKIKKWFTLLQGKPWIRKIKVDSIDHLVKKLAYYQNRVLQTTRVGNANVIITNGKIASLLQDHPTHHINTDNTKFYSSGIIYPIGTVFGMTIFVDPNMTWNSDMVIMARSNNDLKNITSGVALFYDVSDENITVQTMAEEKLQPIITLSIPYSIVSLGKSPEKNYMTLYFELGKNVTL